MKECSLLACYRVRNLNLHMPQMKIIAFISNRTIQAVKSVCVHVCAHVHVAFQTENKNRFLTIKVLKQRGRQSRELWKPYIVKKVMNLCLSEVIDTTLVI